MNIGVAIVTHNNSRDIRLCVESVRREGLKSIAIVDSASSDNTIQELSQLGCTYEVVHKNRGFAYSANRAALMLNTEYVLFLNPDSFIQERSIKNLVRTIHTHPKSGIIGLLLCDMYGNPEAMACGDEPSLYTMIVRRFFRKRKKISQIPFSVDWVSGGALVIQKKIFDQVGGFDEDFFLYWEDVDLCRRVRENGYSVLMDPTAKVTHTRGGSNLNSTDKATIYGQSADRYFKKHYSTTIWYIQRFLRRLYR